MQNRTVQTLSNRGRVGAQLQPARPGDREVAPAFLFSSTDPLDIHPAAFSAVALSTASRFA